MPDQKLMLEEGIHCFKPIADGRVIAVKRFLFTFAVVRDLEVYRDDPIGQPYITFKGRWCYNAEGDAVRALLLWDGVGDPPGPWVKYKGSEGPERHNPKLYIHRGGPYFQRNEVPEEDTWS